VVGSYTGLRKEIIMTRSKYTDMWEAGHTVAEIIAQAWDDDLETVEYEQLLDTLAALEGTTEFKVNIPIIVSSWAHC